MDDISSEDILLEEDESEMMHLTPAQLVDRMQETWINEIRAPEILPYKYEYVECLLEHINSMEENIETLQTASLVKVVHQLEIDRFRYIIASYLRTRLEKIELHVFHILKEEDTRIEKNELPYLSDGELQFAQEYKNSIEQHFQSVLSFWPGMPPDDWKNNPVVPNLDSFVFLKSKENVEGVIIDDSDENDIVDLKEGSQVILSYSKIADLLKNDKVSLL
ncbi:DNA replication complex GINS protein SLD5 [Agrilus planipennis]|uniref:DNA replication complex GINS protein SLD5 n=1 Tax=Agrilus planipennis TaxID=224129 RepID=A0A1W4WGI3_AGRPL|nr:DNA replication complex GINS protein SLD5 [Agrilus planipennis]